jgi:hypothetical protein
MVSSSFSPVLEAFRGDFGALAAMMQRSWAGNNNQALFYTEAFLRSAFDYPGSSFKMAPAAYADNGLVGFVAGFRRSVLWDARPAQLVLNSFLTASAEVKGAGLGLALWANLVERARKEGFDGTINFCVEGDEMNRMMPGISRLLRLNTQRIFSVEFLVRLLNPAAPEPLPSVSDSDIDLFLELASVLPSDLPLKRLWTQAEAAWQCRERAGAITATADIGGRRGVLTGYLTQIASTPPVTAVVLEDLLWGNLESVERIELLTKFLKTAARQGARTASCPNLGYSSLDTLLAGRFRRSNRVLHTYLTFWNGLEPRPVASLYLDVM